MLEFPEMESEVMPGFRPLPVKWNGVGEWPGCELKKCCKVYVVLFNAIVTGKQIGRAHV